MIRKNLVALSLPVGLALTACGSAASQTPAAEPTPMAAPAPTSMAAPAPAPMAAPEPAPAAAPEPPKRELAATPDDKLGSVPPGLGLKVGSKAPDATLLDVSGKAQRLATLYAQGPTFVVFYRGGWCPFCNLQLHALTNAKPDFDQKGLKLIAISVDQPGEEAKTQAQDGVPFPMLSDSKLVAHKAFNVVHVPADAEAQALAGHGIDLEKYSGEPHHSFAVPSIFLIDRTGKIRWEHIDNDFKTRPTPAQMLDAADRVLAKKK